MRQFLDVHTYQQRCLEHAFRPRAHSTHTIPSSFLLEGFHMQYIPWENAYALDLPEIDAQHKELLVVMNTLWECVVRSAPQEELNAVLDQLKDYTRSHFVAEETLMRIQEYPKVEDHLAQHQEFIDQLTSARDKIAANPAKALELLSFLKDWLVMHIDRSDRHYAEYFAKNKPSGGLFSRLFKALRS